jgi:hypothetical protein
LCLLRKGYGNVVVGDVLDKLDTGCWMLDAGYWMLDTGCWILDAGYWILDARCLKKAASFSEKVLIIKIKQI